MTSCVVVSPGFTVDFLPSSVKSNGASPLLVAVTSTPPSAHFCSAVKFGSAPLSAHDALASASALTDFCCARISFCDALSLCWFLPLKMRPASSFDVPETSTVAEPLSLPAAGLTYSSSPLPALVTGLPSLSTSLVPSGAPAPSAASMALPWALVLTVNGPMPGVALGTPLCSVGSSSSEIFGSALSAAVALPIRYL